ncbi:MAG: energy-coupled thiamine transporter ThiT [Actinobacteria bacterium HGW-Actinobacteria-7]|nr:MAG: energy-coupled thiamine transporter ThiT [Actinobacteria bacterium HGW-Actinobacteria-7]
MRSERIRTTVEVALCVGLAAVLSVWKVTLPWNIAGGSISLAMLPIFVIALRRGVIAGVVTGLLYGVIDYLLEPFFVHWIQVLLDYGVAFAACGLAGVGAASVRSAIQRSSSASVVLTITVWTALGGLSRLAASVLSGIVFFGADAPAGQPVVLYSLLYNASYLVPSLLATVVLTAVIVPVLSRAVPVGEQGRVI